MGLEIFRGRADIKLVHPRVARLGDGLRYHTSNSARVEPARLHCALFSERDVVDAAVNNDMKNMNTLWTELAHVALTFSFAMFSPPL